MSEQIQLVAEEWAPPFTLTGAGLPGQTGAAANENSCLLQTGEAARCIGISLPKQHRLEVGLTRTCMKGIKIPIL